MGIWNLRVPYFPYRHLEFKSVSATRTLADFFLSVICGSLVTKYTHENFVTIKISASFQKKIINKVLKKPYSHKSKNTNI